MDYHRRLFVLGGNFAGVDHSPGVIYRGSRPWSLWTAWYKEAQVIQRHYASERQIALCTNKKNHNLESAQRIKKNTFNQEKHLHTSNQENINKNILLSDRLKQQTNKKQLLITYKNAGNLNIYTYILIVYDHQSNPYNMNYK